MEHHPLTWISLIPGLNTLPSHSVHATLVAVLILAFASRARSQLAVARAQGTHLVPETNLSARNLAELFVDGMNGIAEGVLGISGRRYVALFGSLFLFILLGNLMGLVPGFAPPTSDFNITFGLGVAAFLGYNAIGIKAQGLGKYLKHFLGPIWWLAFLMAPLEIVDNLVRPVSLALRLFGNMTGDHLVLEIFTNLTYLVIPVAFYFLGAFVSLIQAFVFTLLTVIYVSLAVGHGEEHH
ncbi:MAG: F-type H+-transporting ATPase subunit a [Hyphomicrobiaceae bacterium]|jgi:F-type H+-transporting ATPase subunit a